MSEVPDRPAVSPFRRRSFLASAALATGAPVVAAGPAQAAALPESVAPAASAVGSVARLMAVAESGRGVEWIRSSLQVAVGLELATIPPYLCGWWSVKDRRSEVARMIRRIVGDEMYHLSIVCNLLVGVGGRPQIKAAAPVFPGPLPGGLRAGVNVYLSGLSKAYVRDVMMAIEAPEDPLTRSATSPTVGEFYAAMLKAFKDVRPELSVRGQVSEYVGGDNLRPIENLDHVERAIEIIREQGEGTSSSPADPNEDDERAHYYAFGEIYHGRELRETEDGWRYVGGPVPFPAVRPMAPVPAGGWPTPQADHVRGLLHRFDATYSTVLDTLDSAWSGGGHRALNAAEHAMRGLERPAVELMETPLPHAPGHTYGPQFRALPRPPRAS
ncbi:ferritin-like domain-containing protein [Streptomyces sp. NPDC054940]